MSGAMSGIHSVSFLGASNLSVSTGVAFFYPQKPANAQERRAAAHMTWRQNEKVFESRSGYDFQLNNDFYWDLLAPALHL